MTLPSYSIAIRTLGTSGDKFMEELKSIKHLTVQPDKIIIYLAEGYQKPTFSIGKEEYIFVKKGMVTQRAQDYRDLSSEYMLLLDDDVKLAPDSVETLLKAAIENHADCVGADTFKNQEMSRKSKFYAILTNLVFPRSNDNWAFKINRNGSFSYNNHPKPHFYLSQSCAGPASLWKKESFLAIQVQDECWLDKLDFAYGEDVLTFYKLYINGYKLGIHYGANIDHLDGKSSSSSYQKNIRKFYTRSKASYIIWWRSIYNTQPHGFLKIYTLFAYLLKAIWLLLINLLAGFYMGNLKIPYYYVKGIFDGIHFINSPEYKCIPNYILKR